MQHPGYQKVALGLSSTILAMVFSMTSISAQDDPTVTVVGLSIVQQDPEDNYGGPAVMGYDTGTTIFVSLKYQDALIVRVKQSDEDRAAFMDSTETELTGEVNQFGFFANVTDDGKSAIIPFNCAGFPAPDSQWVRVSASVTLLLGSETETSDFDVELAEQAEIEVGGIELKVTEISDGFFADGGKAVTLESSSTMDSFVSFEAVLADGKVVTMNRISRTESGFSGNRTYANTYEVPVEDVSSITAIRVARFTDLEEVQVDIEATTDLGSFHK